MPVSVRYSLVCRKRACSEVCSTSGLLIHCSSGSFPTTLYYKSTSTFGSPHTQTHSQGVYSHPCTCAHRITLICRKTQQQQTMSVLFISGLDVPNCFKDFLWLTTVGVSKSVYAVSFFFRKQCDERFPQSELYSSPIVRILVCFTDHASTLYVTIIVCVS